MIRLNGTAPNIIRLLAELHHAVKFHCNSARRVIRIASIPDNELDDDFGDDKAIENVSVTCLLLSGRYQLFSDTEKYIFGQHMKRN